MKYSINYPDRQAFVDQINKLQIKTETEIEKCWQANICCSICTFVNIWSTQTGDKKEFNIEAYEFLVRDCQLLKRKVKLMLTKEKKCGLTNEYSRETITAVIDEIKRLYQLIKITNSILSGLGSNLKVQNYSSEELTTAIQ